MKIKNFKDLAITPERKDALQIAEKGLQAIDTKTVLKNSLGLQDESLTAFGQKFTLSKNGQFIIVCIGKCAAQAAVTFEEIFGERIDRGLALGVGEMDGGEVGKLSKIKYLAGTHPMPSEQNRKASQDILMFLQNLSESDTVLFLISGGGSTLLTVPPCSDEQMTEMVLEEKNLLHELFKAGATIQEINTLRKHMSLARGGYIAKQAFPAKIISIIFSDVPGNEIGFIASGPTVKDETTVEDAKKILEKYGLQNEKVCLNETPKEDKYFEKSSNILAVSNELALQAMKKEAEILGYKTKIEDFCIVGEAKEVAKNIAREINGEPAGSVLLYCGETTVTIKVSGRGGRNQELALAALSEISPPSLIMTLASDGHDNGPHAGAIADTVVLQEANSKNLDPKDYLERNESSLFFESAGGLLETGDTGSNVSDLILALSKKL